MSNMQNIVMVSWDSVRADHMPFHGYHRNTCPFVNEKAEEGVVFENTQVSAVGTPASFSGMFTGEHASGSMENPSPGHWRESLSGKTLLPEVLQKEGYYTGGFHYNALMSSSFGWDRGWDVYEDHMWDEKGGNSPSDDSESDVRTEIYNFLQKRDLANFAMHLKKMTFGEAPLHWVKMWDEIEKFVEEAPEPWFLWVLLIDTHHPYYSPVKYHEWNQPGIRPIYALNYTMRHHGDILGERNSHIVNAYDNTIRYADEFTRRLSEKLESEGFEDTPFIFHSDHGDEMGEHANYGHRPLMYNTVTQVPLVMWNVDRQTPGGPHTLLDLGSTVLDIAGSDERLSKRPSMFEADHDSVYIQNLLSEELGTTAAVVGEEWKVLCHPQGEWGHGLDFDSPSEEAYHSEDRFEKHNRWGEHPDDLEKELNLRMENAELTSKGDSTIDSQTEERLRELGYIE